MDKVTISLIPAVGMMIVAITALVCWRRVSRLQLRWFWLDFANGKHMMIIWGFLIFTLADGVVGTTQISGKMGQISVWWIELAVLPFALVNIPILHWCYRKPGSLNDKGAESL
jgi:hypothetical protein